MMYAQPCALSARVVSQVSGARAGDAPVAARASLWIRRMVSRSASLICEGAVASGSGGGHRAAAATGLVAAGSTIVAATATPAQAPERRCLLRRRAAVVLWSMVVTRSARDRQEAAVQRRRIDPRTLPTSSSAGWMRPRDLRHRGPSVAAPGPGRGVIRTDDEDDLVPAPLDTENLRRAPKVLLHDHLDGGLRPQTVLELADEYGYTDLPARDADSLRRGGGAPPPAPPPRPRGAGGGGGAPPPRFACPPPREPPPPPRGWGRAGGG